MMKRILVGLAGTPYTPVAIQRAVALAAQHQAEVTGVTVIDMSKISQLSGVSSGTDSADNSRRQRLAITRDHVEQALTDFQAACDGAGVKGRIIQESDVPFTKLIDLARYHDVMVFGMRSVFEHDFLCEDPHSLLVRLVAAGVRPMIAVSPKFRFISRVLIAYGGSMESAKAMKRFVQLRLWPEAQLKIMTFNESESEASRLAHDAADYCRAHGYHVDAYQTNTGVPKNLLLAAATLWQADMIVMGNSARSVLLRRVLGDTALEVLQNTEIPLFLCQ